MDKGIDKKVKDFIAAVIQQNYNLVTAYMFGSYVKGKQQEDSDIDIALIIDHLDDSEKFDVQVQLMLLASHFDTRIEPHPFSKDYFDSDYPFPAEIKRTGIEIKPQTPNTI